MIQIQTAISNPNSVSRHDVMCAHTIFIKYKDASGRDNCAKMRAAGGARSLSSSWSFASRHACRSVVADRVYIQKWTVQTCALVDHRWAVCCKLDCFNYHSRTAIELYHCGPARVEYYSQFYEHHQHTYHKFEHVVERSWKI